MGFVKEGCGLGGMRWEEMVCWIFSYLSLPMQVRNCSLRVCRESSTPGTTFVCVKKNIYAVHPSSKIHHHESSFCTLVGIVHLCSGPS